MGCLLQAAIVVKGKVCGLTTVATCTRQTHQILQGLQP